MGTKKPRPRRSFTREFKAEIVELCWRGDRSVGQVAKDFDLTETAVRDWIRQAEVGSGACDWEKAGFGRRQRKGGCINLGVSRVFVMSKSRNATFLEVIKHIEKALNPSVNAGTAPPKRPGHNWADPMHLPLKTQHGEPHQQSDPRKLGQGRCGADQGQH
ncbi:transposase [Nonomuraea sp. NPDC050394]|uniref:transposase n=1 Tax=Nonomuraea sp. NPDC050394 TaxID=3364363 RepID=UPI0037ADCFB9